MHSNPIVLALVWKGPLLLIAKRRAGAHLGGLWEFPGGRLEAGESAADAAVREVLEETAVVCKATRIRLGFEFDYPDRKLAFQPVDCVWVSGEPEALESGEPRWVNQTEVAEYEFPPANAQLISELRRCWPRSG